MSTTQPDSNDKHPETAGQPQTEQATTPGTGSGTPDYSHVQIKTEPDLPREVKPGGSATEPESGGGYSN